MYGSIHPGRNLLAFPIQFLSIAIYLPSTHCILLKASVAIEAEPVKDCNICKNVGKAWVQTMEGRRGGLGKYINEIKKNAIYTCVPSMPFTSLTIKEEN